MNMLKRAAIHKSGQGSDKVVKKGHRVAYAVPPFHNWQYLSMRVAAKTAYTSLRIILVYECNAKVFKCVFTPMQHSQARCSS